MKSDLFVTIVTPSYNQGQFIEQTILSVLNQTYKNIQYIVVDGGSKDSTMEIVEKYKDKIDIIIHEPDNGQSDAINKGFRLAKGELVGWLNSDDILYPTCIEEIVKLYMQFPGEAIYYGSKLNFIDRYTRVTNTISILIENKETLLKKNYDVNQMGSFYNLNFLKKCNFLDETIHYCMDLDLFLRLLDYGKIINFDKYPLAGFRFWEDSKTTTGGTAFLKDIRRILYRHGAHLYNKTVLKTYWRYLSVYKRKIKNLLYR